MAIIGAATRRLPWSFGRPDRASCARHPIKDGRRGCDSLSSSRPRWRGPVVDFQVRDTLELGGVDRDQDEVERAGMGGEEQIRGMVRIPSSPPILDPSDATT